MIVGTSKTYQNSKRVKQLHFHIWHIPEIKLFSNDGSLRSHGLIHKTNYPDKMYKVN